MQTKGKEMIYSMKNVMNIQKSNKSLHINCSKTLVINIAMMCGLLAYVNCNSNLLYCWQRQRPQPEERRTCMRLVLATYGERIHLSCHLVPLVMHHIGHTPCPEDIWTTTMDIFWTVVSHWIDRFHPVKLFSGQPK